MTLAIAILMKDPSEAKTRLRSVLAGDARERLALVLFENTLSFFTRFHTDGPVGVVTRSETIAEIGRRFGAEIIAEGWQSDPSMSQSEAEMHPPLSGRTGGGGGERNSPPSISGPHRFGGINAAAESARAWAMAIGATSLLVVHADIPTLIDSEMTTLIQTGSTVAVTIAESADGGTNALLLTPPDVIPFGFGQKSAARHEAQAMASGKTSRRITLPFLSRDIDRPDDLDAIPPRLAPARLEAHAVEGLPEVSAGDDLGLVVADAVTRSGDALRAGDIIVIAQKVVSKSEGRMRSLADYTPSTEASTLAAEIGKDARKVEAILSESREVIRARKQPPDGLLITRHRQGWICANAGIDESNLGPGRDGMLLLLPEDADRSAAAIRATLEQRYEAPIGVIITDTFGRPWRNGLVNVAIGVAGVPMLVDWKNRTDAYGRGLKATLPAFADEIAAVAGVLMQKDAGLPVVIIRGLNWDEHGSARAADVLRPLEQELFL